MRKIKEVLRLKFEVGLGLRQIAPAPPTSIYSGPKLTCAPSSSIKVSRSS